MTKSAAICLLLFVSCACLTYSGGAAQDINNNNNNNNNGKRQYSLYYHEPPSIMAIPNLRLQTGDIFSVQGTPNSRSSRFDINFQKTNSTPDTIIPLHIRVQMYDQTTLFGTRKNGRWIPDQRERSNFPFTAGELFEVKVVVHDDYYDVFVNSKRYFKYNHVLSPHDVHYFFLNRAAQWSLVQFEYWR